MATYGGTSRHVNHTDDGNVAACQALTFSMSLPIPPAVIDRPPKICVASSAVSRPVLVTYLKSSESLVLNACHSFPMTYCFSRPIWPASLSDCSAYDIYPSLTSVLAGATAASLRTLFI